MRATFNIGDSRVVRGRPKSPPLLHHTLACPGHGERRLFDPCSLQQGRSAPSLFVEASVHPTRTRKRTHTDTRAGRTSSRRIHPFCQSSESPEALRLSSTFQDDTTVHLPSYSHKYSCVCMCISMHVCMYVCLRVCLYVSMHACMLV